MSVRRSLASRPGQSRRRLAWLFGGGITCVVAVLAVVVWLVWLKPPAKVPRAHEFRDFDICVLVGREGIASEPAATAWSELHNVAAEVDVRLSYLSVTGPQTQAQARLFVPALAQQGCDIVVAVGANQIAAVQAVTASYPSISFLVVESGADAARVAAQAGSLLSAG